MLKLLTNLIIVSCIQFAQGQYMSVGNGIGDVTGLASEGLLYGYANPGQDARGIHTRQFSRAFVFTDGSKMTCVVIVDVCMITQAVKLEVLEELEKHIGTKFAENNVMLLPTHSHSLPGGYHTYWMYQKASEGFVNETYRILVNGIVKSIMAAYNNIEPSDVYINKNKLFGASVNRSPYAYYNNPIDEINTHGSEDTEKTMYLMKVLNKQQKLTGLLSLFGVHPTSLKNTNHLISTDNMGYAALKMGRFLNHNFFPGKGHVIAAFGQTIFGDSSPNLNGSRCEVTNELCSYNTSTCPEDENNPRLCTGRGPHGDHFKDSEIIGDKIYQNAKRLLEEKSTKLVGKIDYRHQWVKMSLMKLVVENKTVNTCLPAMGYSFGAGATDGPAMPPFTQGQLEKIDAVEKVTDKFFNKSIEEAECHHPKPILLPTGQAFNPYPWQPEILPLQIIKIGHLYLVGVPAEVTTMSGRRIQKAVKKAIMENSQLEVPEVVVVSLANSYSSYLTTFEEYQVQRYEGASNTFGPHTLSAYIHKFEEIAKALVSHKPLPRGPTPPDLRGLQSNALRSLKVDLLPKDMTYGQVLVDADEKYYQTDLTFLQVQEKTTYNSSLEGWTTRYLDSSWETKMYWNSACHDRKPGLNGNCTMKAQLSNATIEWNIPLDQNEGVYRIVHYGHAYTGSDVKKYAGFSKSFSVVFK